MTQDLETRLRALDPAAGAAVTPHDGPQALALRETIMSNAQLDDDIGTHASTSQRHRRRWLTAAAAGGALVVGAAVVGAVVSGGDSQAPSSVTYAVAAPDTMAMCLPINDFTPDADAVAFAGTVVGVDAGLVTVDVGTWYQNGEADQVVLDASGMPLVALDGVEFTAGEQVLVSVFDGTVGMCGTSGPDTPELRAFYDSWYGAA